jgi:hypothetical protein
MIIMSTTKRSDLLLTLHKQTDEQLIAAVSTALQGKAELGASLRYRLREISTLQSRIQEIQHWVKVMRNAQEQKENQFSHLEKVRIHCITCTLRVQRLILLTLFGKMVACSCDAQVQADCSVIEC